MRRALVRTEINCWRRSVVLEALRKVRIVKSFRIMVLASARTSARLPGLSGEIRAVSYVVTLRLTDSIDHILLLRKLFSRLFSQTITHSFAQMATPLLIGIGVASAAFFVRLLNIYI